MKYLIRFIISFSFIKSLRFLVILLSKKKTDVLIYYPQHFNTISSTPFVLTQILATLKKNKYSFLTVEEPHLEHNIRNTAAFPSDVLWIIVILLRKCFRGDNYHIIDIKIGRLLSKIFVNHQFSNIITVSQSFQSILRGMFPNSNLFDYQHGLISNQYLGYINGDRISDTLISNKCHLLLYGLGVQQKLLKFKNGRYLKQNATIIGSPYQLYQKNHRLFNGSILYSFQFTKSQTDKDNRYLLEKTLDFFKEVEQSKLDIKIFIKQHPRFENCIDVTDLYAFSFVKRAPENLEDCFTICSLHLTEYSSVVFDGLVRGIPTILTTFSKNLNIFINEYSFPQNKNVSILDHISQMSKKNHYQYVSEEQINWSKNVYSPFLPKSFNQILRTKSE